MVLLPINGSLMTKLLKLLPCARGEFAYLRSHCRQPQTLQSNAMLSDLCFVVV